MKSHTLVMNLMHNEDKMYYESVVMGVPAPSCMSVINLMCNEDKMYNWHCCDGCNEITTCSRAHACDECNKCSVFCRAKIMKSFLAKE